MTPAPNLTAPRLTQWPRDIPLSTKVPAFLGAVAELLWLDVCSFLGFRVLYRAVARVGLADSAVSYDALALIRVAMRDACVFYVRQVNCLQRSAAVTRMLRRRGLAAKLVIGCQPQPVALHAWVELDGVVVWDHLSQISHYRVLDRI
jgi:hypothetical protein